MKKVYVAFKLYEYFYNLFGMESWINNPWIFDYAILAKTKINKCCNNAIFMMRFSADKFLK